MENKTLIKNAIRFIQQNPKENLSLQTIAENAGFSLTYFDALFQKHTGYSPVEYARKYKLSRSALELRTTQKTVLDIALSYGYESPESFARAFKTCYGQSPSEYRTAHAQEPVTWNELSGKISVDFFQRSYPQLKRVDRERALDYCFSHDLRFHAENVSFMMNGDVEIFTLGDPEDPTHFVCAADYNRADPIVYIVAGCETEALLYLRMLSVSEHFNFAVRIPVNEKWTQLEAEIEELNLNPHRGYDMLLPERAIIEVPQLSGVTVRELTPDDLKLVWGLKRCRGGENCPAAGLQLAFEGRGNPGMRGFGLFVDGILSGIATPVPENVRGICKYDIGWISGNDDVCTTQAIEMLWKYSVAACMKEADLFGNGDAQDDDSPLGIATSERVGLVKTALVLRGSR